MTVPLWCLLVAVIIPYVLAGVGGFYRTRQLGSIDNRHPREQATHLTGPGARAIAAQSNAWEALGVFTAAVFAAHVSGADPTWSGRLALLFLLARIAHAVCYVGDVPNGRSLSFIAGLLCCIGLFGLAIGSGAGG